jgi:hypothetical protein
VFRQQLHCRRGPTARERFFKQALKQRAGQISSEENDMNKTLRLMSIITFAALGLGLVTDGAPGAALADPGVAPQTVSASAFSAPDNYIVHGAHISPVAPASSTAGRDYYQEIDAFESAVGKSPGIVMYFISFLYSCDDGYLPRNTNNPPGDSATRAIMITWSPFANSGSDPGPADYDNILNGSYNSVIDACANKLKARPTQTFLMRFMHEMNLFEWAWYAGQSWNQKADGTGDTAKFIQAWRYVVDRFRAIGTPNVQWVWAPNYASNPDVSWNHYANYYPGDNYVDWIGLSGYNWSTFRNQPILSYSALYDAALTDLQCRYPKPIVHSEIGSVEFSGSSPANKAGWITDAYSRMQTYPLLRAVVWFNDFAFHSTSDADFRVTNVTGNNYGPAPLHDTSGFPVNGSWTSAYNTAVSDPSFTPTFTSSQLLNPPMTRCAGDSVSNNGVLGARPSADAVARTGLTAISFQVGALGLSSNTTFTVSGCPSNVTCTFASTGSTTSGTFTAPWDSEMLNIVASGTAQLGTFTLTITGGGTSTTVQLQVLSNINRVFLPNIQK